MNYFIRFLKDEDGPTAVEYAIMLALIVVVCLGGIRLLGQNTAGSFQGSANDVNSAFTRAGIAGSP